jgi:hypothetical protein
MITVPDLQNMGKDNEFFTVSGQGQELGYININRVNACRVGGCSGPDPIRGDRYDHFYYMAVFDLNLKLLKVVVLDYQSEHGYEICSRSWLKQFIGNSDRKFHYDKNIDAISGATVSVNALITEMNFLFEMMNEFKSSSTGD